MVFHRLVKNIQMQGARNPQGMSRAFWCVAMIPIAIGNERNPDACRDRWVFFNSLLNRMEIICRRKRLKAVLMQLPK